MCAVDDISYIIMLKLKETEMFVVIKKIMKTWFYTIKIQRFMIYFKFHYIARYFSSFNKSFCYDFGDNNNQTHDSYT